MKSVGLFEAKTRLSELCAEVARIGEPILVTRRGLPLVRIEPAGKPRMTIRERRANYLARHAHTEEPGGQDFSPPVRSTDPARTVKLD